MTKINDLELCLVEMTPADSRQPVRSLVVRIVTDAGLEGWGESPVGWRPAELGPRRDALLAVLAGRSIFDIEELHSLEVLAHAPLRCAVEMALWDAVGRAVGQPLCHLLGGQYRRRVPVGVRLSAGASDRLAWVARELADQGFHWQIVTSSGDPQRDLKTLRAIRELTGDRIQLRLDGAARYDLETARDLCAELEYDGLQFFLDPLSTRELYPVASLARQTGVPLALWRAIGGPGDVLAAVRCGAAPFLVVDLCRVGGLLPARECAAVADAARVTALLGGGPSLGIGTAAMLQLAAATAALEGCNECAHRQLRDDVLCEPLEIVDGMISVPNGPGLGVEVDRAKIERHQVT